jgi:N-acetylmuramoyl-L-alanine amidase
MTNWVQDAGHGGTDPGAVSKGNIEKVYTLEAALYVNKRLLDHGIESECTRYKDETLDENERVAKVKRFKKAISHHFNAGGGSGAEAIHSIYANGQFEHRIIDEFKSAGYPIRPRPVYFKKYGNADYYFMHRRTGNCQTTIVEYDFVDGPNAEKIKDESYREGMYECVVRAICKYEGVTYKPLKKEVVNVSEQKLTEKQEAVRQEAIQLGITDGDNPLRQVNQYYVWNCMIPLAKKNKELENRIKELECKIK